MMNQIMPTFMNILRDEEGASLVEYILLVAVVSIAAITMLGTKAKEKFEFTGTTIGNAK
jgi:Flp pilus assembly pilin Flp